jgi:hypothetical protein
MERPVRMAPVIKGRKPGPGFLKFPRLSLREPKHMRIPKISHAKLPQLSRFMFFSRVEDQEA